MKQRSTAARAGLCQLAYASLRLWAFARLRLAARFACVLALITLSGCGGSKGAVRGEGSSGPLPAWVGRGSHVAKGSIFGVGSVTGTGHTALARDTAANRARAEISKILETYSASLAKDYMESASAGGASSDAQHVASAIKTFSASLMSGAEVKAYHQDGDTWYALVELDFERAEEAKAALEKMSPGLGRWVEENGPKVLGELESDPSEPPPSEPPPPLGPEPSPGSGRGTPTAPAEEGPEAKVGGTPPAWTQGQCDRERYLCGVGDGTERRVADIDARAELARIFQSSVESVAKSFMSFAQQISSKTGETWAEVQDVSQHSMVSTDKVVGMSEIRERWGDGKGGFWSLAVIDRAQASAALRERIREKDDLVRARVSDAKGTTDKVRRLRSLKAAAQALAEREALNSDLRVLDQSGKGVEAPHSLGEVVGLLESAHEALRLGLALAGPGAERVRDCIEQALTDKGYQIEANVEEEEKDEVDIAGDFDVLIKGKVSAEKRGQIEGSEVVEVTLSLKLIHGETKKVLQSFTGSEKGSRGSVQHAAATAAFKVCQRKVPAIAKEIDRYFSR